MPRNTDNFISEQFEEDLLDAYFHFRSCLPVKDEDTGLDYKKSFTRPPRTSPRNLITWAVSV